MAVSLVPVTRVDLEERGGCGLEGGLPLLETRADVVVLPAEGVGVGFFSKMLAQASAVGRPMREAIGENACRKVFRTGAGMALQLRIWPGVGRQWPSLGW